MAMIPFDDAFEIVSAHKLDTGVEPLSIHQCVGRILAHDVESDIDFPPFDKSAMDGYACRADDIFESLELIETIPAGSVPSKTVGAGQCSKIMTGAKVPNGADCVFMIEQAEEDAGRVRYTGQKVPDNICRRGEDIKAGEIVLTAGTRIEPAHVAVLAGIGCVVPIVTRHPKVGILVTGSELVSPTQKPSDAQIRETNGYQLRAQLEMLGLGCSYYGVIEDDETLIEKTMLQAMDDNDVVLICGGSSVGDFDFVPVLLEKHCDQMLIEKVDIKPGKPLMFATHKGGVCFGMPGNPVSTYVLMELLVKPFLNLSMGHIAHSRVVQLKLNKDLKIRCARRQTFIPVQLVDGGVERISFHGSAHIHAMCNADGLITFPSGENFYEAGSLIDVRLL
ncbi:MAG: molybdopterin molybdotransferase MoeA [Pontiella sp.]